MNHTPHLYLAISSHGYGHAAQVVPVVNALRAARPDLRLSVRADLPRAWLADRVQGPFTLLPGTHEVGLVMASPTDARLAESAAFYQDMLDRWETLVAEEAAVQAEAAPDLVLADVPVLPLAAAARRGTPAVALCSLNWADIYRHYLGDRPEAAAVHARLHQTYAQARLFLQPTPHMPMADLPNRHPIGPLATRGRKQDLHALLGLPRTTRLALVAFGGIGGERLDGPGWRAGDRWRFLRLGPGGETLPDSVRADGLGLPFVDLVASADVVITKSGYGTFVEAAVHQVPVVNQRRPDWPEDPYLTAWLETHGRLLVVDADVMRAGDFVPALETLVERPAPPAPALTGAPDAVTHLFPLLERVAGFLIQDSQTA